jgi:hypothetical protein
VPVIDWLQTALTGFSLLLALLALGYVVVDRFADRWLLTLVAVVAAGTVLQLILGVTKLTQTSHDVAVPSFVGYLIGLVLIPPIATVWALGERSRSGTAVFVVAGLLIPVMLLRLETIWTSAHA